MVCRGWIRHGLSSVLAVAATALLLAPAGAEERTIRIATEGAYPPFNYVDKDEPAGFEVDLSRALCAAMRAACTIVLQDWEGLIPGLKAHQYDAIVSSMEITPERGRKIAFSDPYYRIPAGLIGPKDAPAVTVATPADLAGKTVGTVAESEFASFLDGAAATPDSARKGPTVKTFDSLESADLDLLTGRLDFVLGDRLALESFLSSREGKMCCRLVTTVPVDRGEGVGIGLRRDDSALRAAFNAAIAAVIADGTYDRVRAAYFPFDIKPPAPAAQGPGPARPAAGIPTPRPGQTGLTPSPPPPRTP